MLQNEVAYLSSGYLRRPSNGRPEPARHRKNRGK